MADSNEISGGISVSAFSDVPVEISVLVGHASPRISELLDFTEGQVLPLDTNIDDPVCLYVGTKKIATGELEEIEEGSGRIGVRIIEVSSQATNTLNET